MTGLLFSLIRRDIVGRYRGSVLGLLWTLIAPLFMLAVYTFVFGYVFSARWTAIPGSGASHPTAEFAVVFFSGMVLFQLFAEVLSVASGLIVSHANYVKKVVFPIQILPMVTTGAALFHFAVSVVVLLGFILFVFGAIPMTALLAPLAVAPLVVLTIGIAWLLAAIGVYFRDIGQIVPPILTATMFLSPIFFPRTALPDFLQPYLSYNPLTIPMESFRALILFGEQPDWMALGYYSLAAIAVALFGVRFFQLMRRGFADVL